MVLGMPNLRATKATRRDRAPVRAAKPKPRKRATSAAAKISGAARSAVNQATATGRRALAAATPASGKRGVRKPVRRRAI
jgi:hypothetical protein